jgi:thiamine-phosphate pyrophosphorylase
MFEILALTNRRLCPGDFSARLEALAASGLDALVLREKDLSPEDYRALAEQALALCREGGAELIVHRFVRTAESLGLARVHLPLGDLEALVREAGGVPAGLRAGVSVHSLEEARRAQSLGAGYLIAGHIFASPSKEGLPGRGLPFLAEICRALPLPVYAIGGVTAENIRAVREAGAAGACVLSPFMRGADLPALVKRLRAAL